MDDMIVTVRFTDIGEARRALRELEQLDRDGRLRVRGAALVERSGQGRIELSEGARDDTGHILPPAGTAGMLVDVLGGPPVAPYFGLASGFLTGKYRSGGPAVDSARAGGAAGLWEAGGAAKLEALDG